MSLFNFKNTRSEQLGAGVAELALLKPQTNAPVDLTGAGRLVRGFLNPVATVPQHLVGQMVTAVSLKGNGVYLAGQLTMQSLTDFERKRREREQQAVR